MEKGNRKESFSAGDLVSRNRVGRGSEADRQSRVLAAICGLMLVACCFSTNVNANTIASFENADLARDWAVVNDTVMGGVSRSDFEFTENGTLLFRGSLSLENNGGFVSIRNRPSRLDLGGFTGVEIRVRGDGRPYYLDLRTSGQRMAGSFRASFDTIEDGWTDIFLPFSSFGAQSFGRPVRGVRLDPADIVSIGFTLSDKRPGPFTLEVEYVSSVEEETGRNDPPLPAPDGEFEPQMRLIALAISRGAPLFNEGNPAACAAVYEVACAALLSTPGLPDEAQAALQQALAEIEGPESDVDAAWILRYALDDTLAALSKR